ncbi:MAG: helix-turn-helix domain-containing protein [Thermoleophilia bacterium]
MTDIRTCGDCKYCWHETCPVRCRHSDDRWAELPACDHSYVPHFIRAWKDLGEVLAAPFIPLLDKIEKWLEERGNIAMSDQAIKKRCADCGNPLGVWNDDPYQNADGEDICDRCHHGKKPERIRRSHGQYGPREIVQEETYQALNEFNEATAEQIAQELGIPYRTTYQRLVKLMYVGRVTRRRHQDKIFLIGHPPYFWRAR